MIFTGHVKIRLSTMIFGVLFILFLFPGFSYAASNTCTTAEEDREFYFRSMYTQFMISSEKCGASREYAKFMNKYKKDILGNADSLKTYYKRNYGKGWKKQMDAFLTKIANKVSIGTNGDDYYKFCYASWKKFHVINDVSDVSDITSYIHEYGRDYVQHLPRKCKAERDFWVKELPEDKANTDTAAKENEKAKP